MTQSTATHTQDLALACLNILLGGVQVCATEEADFSAVNNCNSLVSKTERRNVMKKHITHAILIALSLLSTTTTHAQWVGPFPPPNGTVYCLATFGTELFAGTDGGVFSSTNYGSWGLVNAGLPNRPVRSLALSRFGGGLSLFAGTWGRGVYRLDFNGTNWTQVNSGLPDTLVSSLAISGTNLFAGTDGGGGVFLSTNNGTSWTAVNKGLRSTFVDVLFVSGTNLLAGGDDGVYWRPLSEMVTLVERLSTDLPRHFSLAQNYPNPFNPSTTIELALPKSAFVTLRVYDLLGRQVGEQVNEKLSPGMYKTQWDARGLPSGVYFYRLSAGDPSASSGQSFAETKRLILVK